MKEEIEQILAEIKELKCKTEKDIEDARVRLLGKKGEITKLFEEFRTVAPELKKEFASSDMTWQKVLKSRMITTFSRH